MSLREAEIDIADRRSKIFELDIKIKELKQTANGSYSEQVKDILNLRSVLSREQSRAKRSVNQENRRRGKWGRISSSIY